MDKLAELLRQGADKLVNLPTEAQRFVTNPQAFIQLLTGKNALPKETGFAAGATGLPAQQGTVLDPNYQSYMQGYEQGEPVSYAVMATPAALPVAKALAPKAGQMAENYMINQGFMPSLIAYHGTPHTIKGKFDISKVGTGEGAQAYGHGMYFAENPAVAGQYAKELGTRVDVNGKPLMQQGKIVGSTGNAELDDFLVANLGDVKAAKRDLLQSIKEVRPTNPEAAKDYQRLLADLRKTQVSAQSTGNLYKVNIPDEYIPNMLDWDKPFKEQTAFVQQAIKQIEPKLKKIAPDINVQNLTGKQIYQAYQQFRGNQPDFASEGLNELGIKGIRYLDQQSRTPGFSSLTPTQLQARIESLQSDIKAGGGNTKKMQEQLQGLQNELDSYRNMTSNFVVFDPSNVKILEQNSKPMTRKEIIEQELKKVVE